MILDEAYFEFAKEFDDYPDSMDYRYDNVITLRTFSKAYGLSGVRVGYGFGHEELIKNLTKVKLPFEPNLIGQLGATGALLDDPHLERTLGNNRIQYKRCVEYLLAHNFKPISSVTNFITLKTGSPEASDFFFEFLLNLGVIIRPLKVNNMPEFIRISIGTPEEMDHLFEALDKMLPEYDKKFGRAE